MRQLRKPTAFHSITAILLTGCLWLTLTTATRAASGIVLYNTTNGAVSTGTIYADGHFIATGYYPSGSFATGWSHIVRANNGLLFFFRETDGLWATVQADIYGNLITLRQGYLPFTEPKAGDTRPHMHVISTANGILICRGVSGYTFDIPRGGLIGQVRNDGFFQVTQQPNFSAWSTVINTPNGVFFLTAGGGGGDAAIFAIGRIQPNGIFVQTHGGYIDGVTGWKYQKVTAVGNDIIFFPLARTFMALTLLQIQGSYRVGGINSNGQFALRSTECSPALAGGDVVPIALGNDLLLYAVSDGGAPYGEPFPIFTRLVSSGWAMVGTFRSQSNFLNPSCWGKLRIKQEYPEGSFAAGWQSILYSTDGTFFYNPDTGAAQVGKFDTNGAFTQTHDLPSWFDPGYSHVINVTQ